MATYSPSHGREHLHAVVDMGSNGIRFSISNLQQPTARTMPTLYQHREAISLYDAQYSASGERQPIDEATISAVIASFQRFRQTCNDFSVPTSNITVLATEATRTATNSEDFCQRIQDRLGWNVTMLPKEDEGRVGAMGIASSLPEVSGLVMDLGGGSTQLSWLIKNLKSDEVRMPEQGAVSMPYGAAAMMKRLNEAEKAGTTQKVRKEVQTAVKEAYASLRMPQELLVAAERAGGFTLYLSGGGFRGWGYVLMNRHHVKPYPIPTMNGFKVDRAEFLGTEDVRKAAAAALVDSDEDIFRVSDRRASQVPAVAFLISALAEGLPQIKEVRFCQGGVREGFLFGKLDGATIAQHPVIVATKPYDTANSSGAITKLLLSALPTQSSETAVRDAYKDVFTSDLLEASVNLMYYHASHPKDLQASSALRSTTSGVVAGVHGVLHEDRALLALLLCQRWGGNISLADESFKRSLEQLIDNPCILWWINYLGAIAALIAHVYPAGISHQNAGRMALKAIWDEGDKGRPVCTLQVIFARDAHSSHFGKELKGIEKVGKKKRWIGGREGIGHKVDVEVTDAVVS